MRRLLYVLIGTFLFAAGVAQAQVDRATPDRHRQGLVGRRHPRRDRHRHRAAGAVDRPRRTARATYLVLSLSPAATSWTPKLPGFQKSTQTVILEVGQKGRVDFTLGVGGASRDRHRRGARRLLNTEQSSLGTVMDQAKVANLPLAIRNWDDLLALVPGVQGDRFTEQGGGTSFGRTGGVNVHGTRSLQNNFLLDGVDNNSISENVQELTSQVSRPSVDSIQEFKVVTSPYSAEYGRSPGAAISVSTKSGTNQFHGTAVRLLPERHASTRTTSSPSAPNQAKPANDQNQFGGEPRRADRQGQGLLLRRLRGHAHHPRRHPHHATSPRSTSGAGIFGTAAVRDPLTGQPFPGNTIPANRIDPTAAAILALRAGAEPGRREQLLPRRRHHRRLDRAAGPPRLHAVARTTTSSRATSTRTASATSPAPSGASSTARGPRPSATRRSRATASMLGWTRIFSPIDRQRAALHLAAGHLGRRAAALRRSP